MLALARRVQQAGVGRLVRSLTGLATGAVSPVGARMASPGVLASLMPRAACAPTPASLFPASARPLLMSEASPMSLPMIAPEAESAIDGTLQCVKRTYQPNVLIRKRRHGFLSRLRTRGGRRVIERRLIKGRWKLTA